MSSNKEFTSHLRSHNEVKPTADPSDPTGQAKVYNCCLCGKMLSSFSSLDRHMLVHSGERPFSCEVCGQTFTTNGNMHRHRRTHNLRDSCESDGSGGSASKKMRKRKAPSALMSPIDKISVKSTERPRTDEMSFPPLKCPICTEHFYSELSLEVHVLSFHPGKEIRCEDCSHPCPTYNYFKLHRNMFHYKPSSFPPLPPQSGSWFTKIKRSLICFLFDVIILCLQLKWSVWDEGWWSGRCGWKNAGVGVDDVIFIRVIMPWGERFIITFMYNDVVSDILFGVLVVLVPDMSLTVGLCGKSKITYFAFKGFLSCVAPHMLKKCTLVTGGIMTSAYITFKGWHQEVLLVVALESSQVGEHSSAESAGEFSLQLHLFEGRVIILLTIIRAKGSI